MGNSLAAISLRPLSHLLHRVLRYQIQDFIYITLAWTRQKQAKLSLHLPSIPQKTSEMSLLNFPNEILLLTAECLNQTDTNSLLLANRRLAFLLKPRLHTLAIRDRGVWTALQWAASNGSQSLARAVLKTGADVNFLFPDDVPERVHKTALQLAAETADEAMVALLLSYGADVSTCSPRESTALHYAVGSGSEGTVLLLLRHGARISAVSKAGDTPLLWAIGFGLEEIVKVLLENGADVGVAGKGYMPLHWAARLANEAIVKMLLEYGADPSARDARGLTPLEWVGFEAGEAVRGLLKREGDKIRSRRMTLTRPARRSRDI